MIKRNKPKLREENKMGTKPVVPLLISMSLPPMASMFMQYTYNFVDSMFVSWISEDALTAVSLAFPIATLILSISVGLGVGTNALIARKLGQKDQEGANNIVTHSLILSSFISVILTIFILLIIEPFFNFFADDPKIFKLSMDYAQIVAFMAFGNMVHISIQKILQGTGNMIAPMLFQMAGVALNFILDPILIFGLFGMPEMGVKGAALATVIGYLFSMILAFYVLIFRKQRVEIKIKGFKLSLAVFKEIFVIGLPSLVMNALSGLMVIFTNVFLVTYSMTAVAFFGIYFKIQQLITMTVNGLIQGCMPLMSYNYGAQNKDRLIKTFKAGLTISVIFMGLGTVILWIFPENVLGIFRASQDMLEFGIPALRIMSASYVFAACGFLFASYFQATGDVKFSLIVNLMRQLVLLMPAMWILSSFIGISGIWWSFLAVEVITTIFSIVVFNKTKDLELF
jgi:putative MATE family efflux protein